MSKVNITATFDPDVDERDDSDDTGLTAEAFEELNMSLIELGLENIEIRQAP